MRVDGVEYRTVWMEGSTVKMIDQRLLPHQFTITNLPGYVETGEAIQTKVMLPKSERGATQK